MTRIEKGRSVLLFDLNLDKGYLSLSIDGGGLAMMLDPDELMQVAGDMIHTARRIRKRG